MSICGRFLIRIFFLGVGCALAVGRGATASPDGTVGLRQEARTIGLTNSEVSLEFDKASGRLKSLHYHGRELLGAEGGGYVQVAFTSRYDRGPEKWQFRVVRREPSLVEIAFESVDPDCPFDLSAHYILRADEPGFHNYLKFGHEAARSPGLHRLAQLNFCLRADPAIFTWAAVDDERIRPLPPGDALKPEKMVMDSTYLMSDGSYYSKYFYSAEMDERHTVHGVMGEQIGLWITMPSHEHLNGGPEHQELTVHQTENSPVLLRHATAAHYGAGFVVSDSKDGSWSKVSAPWFVYINHEPTRAQLWQDAKRRAAAQVAEWPYPWLDSAEFQLTRGEVSGRLAWSDGKPVGNARVILAAHERTASSLDWQQQWRGYRFYGWTNAEGDFTVRKIRPGLYDLYCWRPGSFGTFVRRGVPIDGETSKTLGTLVWTQPPARTILWQIGQPDRSAREFGFAEDFRQWGLWRNIAAAYPLGVDFVVGESSARQWPFQMAVTQNADGSWHSPAWRVRFTVPGNHTGHAILTFGIAAFEGTVEPQLRIRLNGEPLGSIGDLEVNGATHRSAEHAGYQQREVVFDAHRLKAGANLLELALETPAARDGQLRNTPPVALHWDCLRLEVSP